MPLLTDTELGMDPQAVFELQEKLGEGSYGTVHRALHKRTNTTVAVKILPAESADLNQSIKEINFMMGIQSEFVVEYYGSYLRDADLWIVMEYCGAGSVSDLMEVCNMTLSEDQISVVCRYVLKGLDYMHSMRKIHRDIKAGNILINSKGEAKLADFGVSGQLSDSTMKRQTVIGTPFWMAPEVIQEVGYGTPADIWSLGITCIEMADGRPPYHDIHPMRAIFMIPTKPPPKLEEEDRYSKVFRAFVAKCLTKDPKTRPTADELLQDPFIRRNPSPNTFLPMIEASMQPQPRRLSYSNNFLPLDDDSSEEESVNSLEEVSNDEIETGEVYSIYSEIPPVEKSPSRPATPDQYSDRKGAFGIGLVTKAFEFLSPSSAVPMQSPSPQSAHPSRGLVSSRPSSPGMRNVRKRSITEERQLASLEERRETEIAAIVAKYKRRKEPVVEAIALKERKTSLE